MRQRRANAAQSAAQNAPAPQREQGRAASAHGMPDVHARIGPPQRLLMPGAQLYTTLVQHCEAEADHQANLEYVLDQKLRAAARRAPPPAPPPDFTAAVRASIAQTRIAPPPAPPAPFSRRVVAGIRKISHRAQRAAHLTDTQWRAAVGGIGTLLVALVFGGVGFAVDPGEMFALLGVAGALLVSLLAMGHMLSAVVGAVMGSAVLAVLAIALFVSLAAIWVRLMRQPVEA